MSKARAILGAVREYRFQGSELWVDCGDPHMRVTFLKPELVRVRIVPGGDFAGQHSWDVAQPDQNFKLVPVELQQTQHALFLHSSAFTVRVDKDTAQVEMLTPDGKSFFADLKSPVGKMIIIGSQNGWRKGNIITGLVNVVEEWKNTAS